MAERKQTLLEETLTLMKAIDEEVAALGESKWIQKAIKKPGALHKELGVPEGEKIPAGELKKAAHAGGKEGKRARLALTLKKLRKK